MMFPSRPLYVVQRIAGPQTGPGPGDILIDNEGGRWLEVSPNYGSSSTAPSPTRKLYPDGTIR